MTATAPDLRPRTPDPEQPPLLAVEDLYLHYLGGPGRTVHAVDGVSFALRGRGTALGVR